VARHGTASEIIRAHGAQAAAYPGVRPRAIEIREPASAVAPERRPAISGKVIAEA
jgi:hypothetical protein